MNGKATQDAQIGCPRNHGLTKISHGSERWYHKTKGLRERLLIRATRRITGRGKGGSGVPGAADGGASGEVEVVVQAGEDGAEDVVVQRLRRRPGAGAGAGAGASAALESRAPAPAPAAARLHAGVLLPHLTSRPVRDQGRDRGARWAFLVDDAKRRRWPEPPLNSTTVYPGPLLGL